MGNGGHAAFASILWSPPLKVSPDMDSKKKENFQDCLSKVACDVLLIFGKDDPWVRHCFLGVFIKLDGKSDSFV
jgi:hypothetical protein